MGVAADGAVGLLALLAPNLAAPGSQPQAQDFSAALFIALAVLAARLAAERALLPPLQKALARRQPGLQRVAGKVFDDAWIVVFAGTLTALAWVVVAQANGGCSPWSIGPCLQGWPNHEVSLPLRWCFQAMFGYYLYEMICTALRRGTVLGMDMVVHHFITMSLMVIAHQYTMMRFGLMAMALLDLSNPILHCAKIFNTLALPELDTLKWALFGLFMLTFFVARVVLMPLCVLLASVRDGFAVVPFEGALFCNALMFSIYALQLFWWYKIVKIAVAGDAGKASASAEEDADGRLKQT